MYVFKCGIFHVVCVCAPMCERGRHIHITTAASLQTHTSIITVCHATLSPFCLELMVQLRTLLTVFTFILKAEARDYMVRGVRFPTRACGV